MRYTEYHAGKAVIKDKSLLPQAMKKLAKLEDIEDRQREKERIMNDDLISRKALLDEVKSFRCSITGLRAGKGVLARAADEYRESILKIIEDQPTEFDKEKVIEQLNRCRIYQFQGMLPDGRVCHFSDVIEIVEKGGIDGQD